MSAAEVANRYRIQEQKRKDEEESKCTAYEERVKKDVEEWKADPQKPVLEFLVYNCDRDRPLNVYPGKRFYQVYAESLKSDGFYCWFDNKDAPWRWYVSFE